MRPLLLLALCLTLLPGCGSSGSAGSKTPPPESAHERAWRVAAQQFSHELELGLQNLDAAARSDALAAAAQLGPLDYCEQNLEALGPPPGRSELAYGSLAAACAKLAQGAGDWRQESYDAAGYAIRKGLTLLRHGEDRLSASETAPPRLVGAQARADEDWAGKLEEGWAWSVRRGFASIDKKLAEGESDPLAALWAEHSGGDASQVACGEDLDRFRETPPDTLSASVKADLEAACAKTRAAGYPRFRLAAFRAAEAKLRRALAELTAIEP